MSTSIQSVGGANPLTYDMIAVQQMRQDRTPQQSAPPTMAPIVEPPRTAAQPINVSTDTQSSEQQMSQRHYSAQQLVPNKVAQTNNANSGGAFDVAAFTQSIEVQRAASRLIAKANELEQLAQELRSQSRSQQNEDTAQQVKAQLAISDASKATSASNNVDT